MGVRTLVGTYDGTTPAAVMVDSTSGSAFGPIFEGNSAPDDIEEFLGWLRREPYRSGEVVGFLTWDMTPSPLQDAIDPRSWPSTGLQHLVDFWRREVWSGRESAIANHVKTADGGSDDGD